LTVRWALLVLCMSLLSACQPANPPPTPLPTKEKTIDKVKADIDKAMQKAQEIRDAADPETNPEKKGS
jgi:hypothetical protein